jgi:hypothetical protein
MCKLMRWSVGQALRERELDAVAAAASVRPASATFTPRLPSDVASTRQVAGVSECRTPGMNDAVR